MPRVMVYVTFNSNNLDKSRTMIISGKDLSKSLKEDLKSRVAELEAKHGTTPNLVVILVGEDPGSVSYVTGKAKAATEVGIRNTTLRYADTIIIDEVSMVRCDIIDAIDYTMRKALRTTLPFGGKQMVFVGDMFQLPPVVSSVVEKDILRDIYQTEEFFFYKAHAIKRMRMPKIEFQKVYRQLEDQTFLHILENVRLNKVTPENLMNLNKRVSLPSPEEGLVITLASRNKTADKINQDRLADIANKEFVYEGTVTGKFEEKKFPVDFSQKRDIL